LVACGEGEDRGKGQCRAEHAQNFSG
jgi:hypothetical protein